MENVKKLLESINLLNQIHVSGKENMTALIMSMQLISDVAKNMTEAGTAEKE